MFGAVLGGEKCSHAQVLAPEEASADGVGRDPKGQGGLWHSIVRIAQCDRVATHAQVRSSARVAMGNRVMRCPRRAAEEQLEEPQEMQLVPCSAEVAVQTDDVLELTPLVVILEREERGPTADTDELMRTRRYKLLKQERDMHEMYRRSLQPASGSDGGRRSRSRSPMRTEAGDI